MRWQPRSGRKSRSLQLLQYLTRGPMRMQTLFFARTDFLYAPLDCAKAAHYADTGSHACARQVGSGSNLNMLVASLPPDFFALTIESRSGCPGLYHIIDKPLSVLPPISGYSWRRLARNARV